MSKITNDGTSRLDIMKNAAKAVLDTLYKYDYATVIDFASDADGYSSTLLPVNDENRCKLENYIDSFTAFGNTNYESAFEKAYEIMTTSMAAGDVSGCNAQIILFLTDGQITSGRHDIVDYIEELKDEPDHEGISFNILTYGIGEDLDEYNLEKLQNISCNNDGIAYEIANIDDSLSTTMASYYQMFSLSRQIQNDNDTWIMWVDYYDLFTGYLLFAACVPVYDKTTDPYQLLGIAVVDVASERLIDSNASTWNNSVGIHDDWEEVYEEMQETAKLCPLLNFDPDQLEVIRRSSQNAKTCSTYTTSTANPTENSDENIDTMDDSSDLSNGEITAIIIGGVAVLVGVILGMCLYQVRKLARQKEEKMQEIAVPGQR